MSPSNQEGESLSAGRHHPVTATGCPDLEVLAAFADGRLDSQERSTVTRHLATCADCHEVVAETLAILQDAEEEGEEDDEPAALTIDDAGPVPRAVPDTAAPISRTPSRSRRTRWRGPVLALAAMALVAFGIAWLGPVLLGPRGVGELAPEVAGGLTAGRMGKVWEDPGWPRLRGPAAFLTEPAKEFRLGVRTVDLQLALILGDPQATPLIREIGTYLQEIELADVHELTYEDLLEDGHVVPTATRDHVRAEERLRRFLDSRYYELGQWIEGVRLAAIGGNRQFLERAFVRRFLARKGAEWPERVTVELGKIDRILEDGVDESELPALIAATSKIRELDGVK